MAYVGQHEQRRAQPLQHERGHDARRRHRAGQPLYAKYGKTAGVENLAWKGKTRYNGLQMKLDRQFRNGWLVTNSYTYGRARDYANDNGGPSTPADPERSWGYGNFDRTHIYVSSFVWSLPWFKDTDAAAPCTGSSATGRCPAS